MNNKIKITKEAKKLMAKTTDSKEITIDLKKISAGWCGTTYKPIVDIGKPGNISTYVTDKTDEGYQIYINKNIHKNLKNDQSLTINTSGFLFFKSLNIKELSPYTVWNNNF